LILIGTGWVCLLFVDQFHALGVLTASVLALIVAALVRRLAKIFTSAEGASGRKG
jgi:hypothetical protein